MLSVEDADLERSTPESVQAILVVVRLKKQLARTAGGFIATPGESP